jgi:trehalose synthase
MFRHNRLIRVEDYAPFIGAEAVERIRQKAKPLQGLHVAHVNSTYYGGGVATLLDSLTSLMNSAGIRTGWRAIQGAPDFFGITKKMHNALQGGDFNLTEMRTRCETTWKVTTSSSSTTRNPCQ